MCLNCPHRPWRPSLPCPLFATIHVGCGTYTTFVSPEMCSIQSGSVCGSVDSNYLSNLTDIYLNTVVFFFFLLLPFLEAVGSRSQLCSPA